VACWRLRRSLGFGGTSNLRLWQPLFYPLYSGSEVWEGIWNQTHFVVLNFGIERLHYVTISHKIWYDLSFQKQKCFGSMLRNIKLTPFLRTWHFLFRLLASIRKIRSVNRSEFQNVCFWLAAILVNSRISTGILTRLTS